MPLPFRRLAGALLVGACLVPVPVLAQPSDLPDARVASPADVAAALLDERHPQKAREELARDAASRAAVVVQALVAGLPDDEDEEYRRIPWIWRVAVAAGRANDEAALLPLFDASLPGDDEPLRDWQAVVLGGGVVMGVSQAGAWPHRVLAPWLEADAARAARWQRALDLAVAMADAEDVRAGTRYDALRMLAVMPWDRVGAQLVRYLAPSVDAELQLGAIGGLSDMPDERAGQALVTHMRGYAEANRRHAVNALLRTPERQALLRGAMAAGEIPEDWLTPEQLTTLRAGGQV